MSRLSADRSTLVRETVIEGTDVDAQSHCRLSRLFNIIQETATEHSVELGICRRDALEKYGCFWMVLRVYIAMARPVLWGETLRTVITPRKPAGSRVYWDCDFYVGTERVGEAVPVFVLVSRKTGKPADLTELPEFALPRYSEKTYTPGRIRFPDEMRLFDTRKLYYSDADMNGHMNNARYVDLACDTAQLHLRPQGAFVRTITISYIGECFPGQTLSLYRGRKDGAMYIHGVGDDGTDRFDCELRMSSSADEPAGTRS